MTPELDPDFYRRANPDLADFDEAAALAHWERHGRDEGRVGAALAVRETFVPAIPRNGRVLEIGPFCAPQLHGDTVEYSDVLSSDQLRARALALGIDASDCPTIHHVGLIGDVTGDFTTIFSSHCIEHQPDLVAHLQGVAQRLRPGGGYYMIVPDKRFCFDHYIAETTLPDIVAAHQERRQRHSVASVLEQHVLATHNDPGRHWAGDHGPAPGAGEPRRVRDGLADIAANPDGYIDTHAWQFSPTSFRQAMAGLHALGLSPLAVEVVYETPRDRLEFCAILRRAG